MPCVSERAPRHRQLPEVFQRQLCQEALAHVWVRVGELAQRLGHGMVGPGRDLLVEHRVEQHVRAIGGVGGDGDGDGVRLLHVDQVRAAAVVRLDSGAQPAEQRQAAQPATGIALLRPGAVVAVCGALGLERGHGVFVRHAVGERHEAVQRRGHEPERGRACRDARQDERDH
eukprot:354029-Chlamydomonas_euryale.AAC.3